MNSRNCFWKYAGLGVAGQIFLCAGVWISAFVFSPRLDPALEALFYFYSPIMWLGSMLGVQGEVGPFLFGISSGSFIYGAIFGIIACFVKRLRSTQ